MKAHRVVYNTCFGGYSLSLHCYLYLKEKGYLSKEITEFYDREIQQKEEINKNTRAVIRKTDGRGIGHVLDSDLEIFYNGDEELCKKKWLETLKMWSYNDTTEVEDIVLVPMTVENFISNPDLWQRYFSFHLGREIPRHSKKLLEAIDALGLEKCGGAAAELGITTITSEAYRIEEYDGKESIEEIDEYSNIVFIREDD